jgi:hypothetical protein
MTASDKVAAGRPTNPPSTRVDFKSRFRDVDIVKRRLAFIENLRFFQPLFLKLFLVQIGGLFARCRQILEPGLLPGAVSGGQAMLADVRLVLFLLQQLLQVFRRILVLSQVAVWHKKISLFP